MTMSSYSYAESDTSIRDVVKVPRGSNYLETHLFQTRVDIRNSAIKMPKELPVLPKTMVTTDQLREVIKNWLIVDLNLQESDNRFPILEAFALHLITKTEKSSKSSKHKVTNERTGFLDDFISSFHDLNERDYRRLPKDASNRVDEIVYDD